LCNIYAVIYDNDDARVRPSSLCVLRKTLAFLRQLTLYLYIRYMYTAAATNACFVSGHPLILTSRAQLPLLACRQLLLHFALFVACFIRFICYMFHCLIHRMNHRRSMQHASHVSKVACSMLHRTYASYAWHGSCT
jgi:hypothetical protein